MTLTLPALFADLEQLSDQLDLDLGTVTPQAGVRLEDDLGMDSLSMMDLLVFLERKYRVAVPNDRLGDVVTAGDVVDLVNQFVPAGVPR
ncbi:acyl carrier protein [Kineosporia succinea]|uniref:Acyl carrier protein n=1 Tax=Kineosporia succinea TaxID=84632 RepID=A0ABT9P6U8_9ACTN|nr:phosphopantetheine-binding protein [Kineosporia succinea]MDP9828417.1 acyl carrier protein [Kineosporia succinea]